MVKSKPWNWSIVNGENAEIWKNPSPESFYYSERWKQQNKKDLLDLGCGIGRHTILFAMNGFNTYAFDLSQVALHRTKEWADKLDLKVDYKQGDMLSLPYKDNSIDCIFCKNVMSHTDTQGIRQIISELHRVLRKSGECFLTLGSKSAWGFQQDWPMVDENTKIRTVPGDPEDGVPHFYADFNLIKNLFNEFELKSVEHVEQFSLDNLSDNQPQIWKHYHILIKK